MELFNHQQKDVYCQNCGTNLTNIGGDVTENGKIYCHGLKGDYPIRCMVEDLLKNPSEILMANYHNSEQVQKDIRKKILTEFGPLEKKLETKSE